MEQFTHICRISKRKAAWLLAHGVVPCEDTGKKTHRYRIRLEDTIAWLRRKTGATPVLEPPPGIFSGGVVHPTAGPLRDEAGAAAWILTRWQQHPEALTIRQAEQLCGYGKSTLNRWVGTGLVEGTCCHGKNLISKHSLAEYLASYAGQRIAVKSEIHKGLLEGLKRE